MKKVLVTGGCGFIGSNLAIELKNKDYNVTVVDNLSSARKDWKKVFNDLDIEIVANCFASNEIIHRIEEKEFDIIFHNAAIPRVSYSVENPFETTDVNIGKTVKLLEASRNNIKRFIFASSSSVYGGADTLPTEITHPKDPKSPYAWQKSSIEDLIKIFVDLHDFDAVCLRYFNVFGPGQFGGSAYSTAVSAWCHAIKYGEKLRSDGSGNQTRDMCYVDNVVSANILAAKFPEKFLGNCYNVACGDRVSNNEILEFLKERHENIEIQHAPSRPGDVMHTQADISKTSDDLNYKPSVRFWEGLQKTLEWWNLND
jgi:nucleoside-diphosphate-sugar epimerase